MIGSAAILRAISTRWDAMNMDTVFTGSIHLGTAPRTTQMPYCVLNVAAEAIQFRTSSGDYKKTEYSAMLLDFTVWHNRGLLNCQAAADEIRNKFDNHDLVLQTDEGSVLRFRWVSSFPLQHPDNTSVWAYTLSYELLRQRTEVVN